MTFASKRPARPVKQYEGANPSAPRATVRVTAWDLEMPGASPPRPVAKPSAAPRPPRDPAVTQGNKIRDSARGEACQVRYVGICTHDPNHTIWSHARWGAQAGEGGRGMGTKADDLSGAYACGACDAAFDQMQGAKHMTRDQLDLDWMMGHLRSLGILARKGLI
jgi:hypothetical protein